MKPRLTATSIIRSPRYWCGPQPELDMWWRHPNFQHGAQTNGHDLGSGFRSLLRLEMPYSYSTLGAVPLFCVFSRGNTTENGSVSAQRSTWQGAKHLKIEGLCQFFDIWKNCFRNLHKIRLLMEFCCHSAKHFHIQGVSKVRSDWKLHFVYSIWCFCRQIYTDSVKVSVKENEVPTEKNSSRASIFATKASYTSN